MFSPVISSEGSDSTKVTEADKEIAEEEEGSSGCDPPATVTANSDTMVCWSLVELNVSIVKVGTRFNLKLR